MGPLVNPLQPTGQVIGVYSPQFLSPIAEALRELGIPKAMVLYGREKLDEAGLGDYTDLVLLHQSTIRSQEINPQDLGLSEANLSALKGGEVAENAEILSKVLQGKGTLAQTEAVALNAALALQVGELVAFGNFSEGVTQAKEILKSGAAWDKLQALVRFLY